MSPGHRAISAIAIAAYKRTLAVNPSYLPALLGLADTQWASGDRATASRTYKTLVDHFPDGTYPSYAKGRADGSGAGVPGPSTTTTAPEPSSDVSPKPANEGDGI